MSTKDQLIEAKFRALAAEFADAGQIMGKPHHLAVRADRIAERAGKLVLRLESSLHARIGSSVGEWLDLRRAVSEDPQTGGYTGIKHLATATFFELVRYFTLSGHPQFNEGDFDLLTGFTAGVEIIPWPDWWNEKSDAEKLEYDELLELQERGELAGRVAPKGHGVRRLKPKAVPNPFADSGAADESDDVSLMREKLWLYARSCQLVAELIVRKSDSPPVRKETKEAMLIIDNNPGISGKKLAHEIKVTKSVFDKAIRPQLIERGYQPPGSGKGTGWRPPEKKC